MRAGWILRIGRVLAIVCVVLLVAGGIVMQLWNALIPDLFHGPQLTFWQAIGLLILSQLLLRGGPRGRSGGWRRNRWRREYRNRMANMTPEERAKFRREWGEQCGWRPAEAELDTEA